MKLVQGVLRFASVGLSPRSQVLQLVRALSTSPVADFRSSIFDEDFATGDQSANSKFFQNLNNLGRTSEDSFLGYKSYASRRSEVSNGLDDEGFNTLSDGMDEKLKEAAYNLEVDNEEVDQEDYAFRPDSIFHPGNTYEPKDLDLRRPGLLKIPPRLEFTVTTEEVLRRADFRNVRFLANFVTEAGIIIKRSQTKISAKAQRKVAREIKTARAFGLMPFTSMGAKHFVFGKTMEDLDKDYQYESQESYNFVDN